MQNFKDITGSVIFFSEGAYVAVLHKLRINFKMQ